MMSDPRSPRAVGRRIAFRDLPDRVTSWVVGQYGPVHPLLDHLGGMSPGCAATLAAPGGDKIFIKAVGRSLNQQTSALFRREIDLLPQLRPAAYRPTLRGAYDDGEWIALVFDHVPSRYPDLPSMFNKPVHERIMPDRRTRPSDLGPARPATFVLVIVTSDGPALVQPERRRARAQVTVTPMAADAP